MAQPARNMSDYPSGFAGGVAIRGMPVLNTYPKDAIWVDSNGTSNGDGTFRRPFSTVDGAVNKAGTDDVILVKSGHAETFTAAAGIDADVAGVTIIGLGAGNRRPTFTFTDTAADIDLDAANVTLQNLRFVCGVNSQTLMIDMNAAAGAVVGCEFTESSATGLTCIDVNGGAANACDKAYIGYNTFRCTTAGNWDRAVELGEVADGVVLEHNIIVGDFDDAGIHNPTGKVLTNLTVRHNYVRNDQAGQHAIELVSACTGTAYGNRLVTDVITTAFDAGALACMDNLWNVTTGGDTEGQPVNPIADAATNFIGVDDSDNGAATTNVAANEDGSVLERLEQVQEAVNRGTGTSVAANKSLADAIGFDGNASVTATAGMLRTMAGTMFVMKKTLTSSAVTQAGVDVTGLSTVGAIAIEAVHLMTNGTGLAAGTNFTLETNNANGKAIFLTEAVSNLGASATIISNHGQAGLADAGSFGPILETGKKVIAKCTVADCTGTGTIDVYLICRRLADNAGLAAA